MCSSARTSTTDRAGRRRALLLALSAAFVSCGEGTPPPPPQPSILVIVNRSQFELQQLFVHDKIDNYRGKSNLLPSPLVVDGQLTLRQPAISNGAWYVTVVREKVRHGALVAVTTATPIDLQGGSYTLWVFDESFRLWKPERLDGGLPRDGPSGDRRRIDLGPTTDGAPRVDTRRSDALSPDAQPADATRLLDRRVGEAP